MVINSISAIAQGVLPGQTFPLGATVSHNGVNFCLFAKGATGVELLLFDQPNAPKPVRVIAFDPKHNRTANYWHIFIPGLKAGQVYGYRVDGPFDPRRGLRFNRNKVLLDPYARAVVGWSHYSREAAIAPDDNCAQALRSVVIDPSTYDWEGDEHPQIPYSRTIIYELHVASFTRNPNSGVAPQNRGTFAGLIEKIPYLKDLGITAVELMPIQQFDEEDAHPGLKNYWGYSTMAFFAPHRPYSSRQDPQGPVDEFRDLVKALHKEGIEVILDVVFNHTAEGDHTGPTLSFKGLSNSDYYILDDNPALYRNYSGCGNTLKMGAVAGNLVLDCLRYWVSEMHVDGFRFDLASALSRGVSGEPLDHPPILWMINSDPVLAGTKIIAEAWDAGGLYQVGRFAGDRFAEWNGPYRDDVRRFVKGDPGMVGRLSNRLIGSPDIYRDPNREPNHSINFVTCHDGFTLNDLVSYNTKHNEANGEHNRDGTNANWSWNCGVEGPTDDVAIEALRLRQIKNFYTILLMSQGTPMLLMGDEVRRTQLGNNNAYCQDNYVSWFDWDLVNRHSSLLGFVKNLISFAHSHKMFGQERILVVTPDLHDEPHVIWHGTSVAHPDWQQHSHTLGVTLRHPEQNEHFHLLLNAFWEPLDFELPSPFLDYHWRRIVDTSLLSPKDFCESAIAPCITSKTYRVEARSVVVLKSCASN